MLTGGSLSKSNTSLRKNGPWSNTFLCKYLRETQTLVRVAIISAMNVTNFFRLELVV